MQLTSTMLCNAHCIAFEAWGGYNQIVVHCITPQLAMQLSAFHRRRGEEGRFEIYAIVQQFYAHRPCDTPKCDMNTLASAHVTKKNKMGRGLYYFQKLSFFIKGDMRGLSFFSGGHL